MKYAAFALLSLIATSAISQETVSPTNLVQPLEYTHQLLIPVAGSAAGGNGTFFRSDINIINFRNVEQRIRLRWLPQGRSGLDVAPKEMVLGASSGFFSEDFVTNVMQETGLGAIQVVAIQADGSNDIAGRLYATSRIWTPHPTAGGTMSQTFPTLPLVTRTDSPPKWIFGVRRDERYRLNVGVVNMSGVKQSFLVQTAGTGESTGENVNVDAEPFSISQANVTGSASGSFQIIVRSITGSPLWEAWASSIDNVTGDAWSMIAVNIPATPTAP